MAVAPSITLVRCLHRLVELAQPTADPECCEKPRSNSWQPSSSCNSGAARTIHGAFGRWTSQGAFGRQRMPCGTDRRQNAISPCRLDSAFPERGSTH